jgi:hypothetical protein
MTTDVQTGSSYLKNLLKKSTRIVGPPPGREASEITFMNAQRASAGCSLSNTYQRNTSIEATETNGDCCATGFKGGISATSMSMDSIIAKKVGQAVCAMPRHVPLYTTISPPVKEKIFFPTEINSFYMWFDASDATSVFKNTISEPATAGDALAGQPTLTQNAAVGEAITYWRSKDRRFILQIPASSGYSSSGSLPTYSSDSGGAIQMNGYEMSFYDLSDLSYGVPVQDFIGNGYSVMLIAQADKVNTLQTTVYLDREVDGTSGQFGPTFTSDNGTITYRYHTQKSTGSTLPGVPDIANGNEGIQIGGQMGEGSRAILYFDRSITTGAANVYVNGIPVGENLSLAPFASLNTRYTTLGRRANATGVSGVVTPSNGTKIYQILIFRNVLSTEERQNLEGYFATQLGFTLPYHHPYYWIPVLKEPSTEPVIERPCKPCYSPGIQFTGGYQLDPYRGNPKPVFARNKNMQINGGDFPGCQPYTGPIDGPRCNNTKNSVL